MQSGFVLSLSFLLLLPLHLLFQSRMSWGKGIRKMLKGSEQILILLCHLVFSQSRAHVTPIAVKCEIRAIPFRDSIAEGVSHPFCQVFMWYRASIAEIPLLGGGGIAPPLRMLSKVETPRKGGGHIAPNWSC